MDNIQILENLISENKPEITLEILSTIFEDNNYVNTQIVLLKGRLRSNSDSQIKGADYKDLQSEYVRINESILNIIHQNAEYCTSLYIPEIKNTNMKVERYEILLWNFVKMMNTKKDYEYYLSKYPESIFTSLAYYAIQNIEEGYLAGTVIVHLTSRATERFEIGALTNFGQFTDVISKLIYPFVNNNKYGREWVLELGHDSNIFLKHGRMIVEDYHSEKVKDVRSLLEMGINDETKLTVKKIGYERANDNEIYSDVIADYYKNICQEILRLSDLPEDIRVRAEQKIKDIEGAKIHFYLLDNKMDDTRKKTETNQGETLTVNKKTFLVQIDKDGIPFKITYFMLWAFLPILLFLFIDAFFWRKVSIADTIIILFMIFWLLISVLAMRYIKNNKQ